MLNHSLVKRCIIKTEAITQVNMERTTSISYYHGLGAISFMGMIKIRLRVVLGTSAELYDLWFFPKQA